jgi:hypothetical protein
VEELRNQRERLRQSGIHAVQAVSASLSASSHLSQVLRHFVEELVGSGYISAHESPGSSPGEHQALIRAACAKHANQLKNNVTELSYAEAGPSYTRSGPSHTEARTSQAETGRSQAAEGSSRTELAWPGRALSDPPRPASAKSSISGSVRRRSEQEAQQTTQERETKPRLSPGEESVTERGSATAIKDLLN